MHWESLAHQTSSCLQGPTSAGRWVWWAVGIVDILGDGPNLGGYCYIVTLGRASSAPRHMTVLVFWLVVSPPSEGPGRVEPLFCIPTVCRKTRVRTYVDSNQTEVRTCPDVSS